jgi:hypothetical protein
MTIKFENTRDNIMKNSIKAEIADRYRKNQVNLLEVVSDLTQSQIVWTPNKETPSVGFHIWHLARWADYLQEIINGRGSQLWEIEKIAPRWNMDTNTLGYAQTGMEMDMETTIALPIPAKGELLDYARRVFESAQQAVNQIEDAQFFSQYECFHGENWHNGQIGPIVITWMTHDNRHLGMIECLIGIQGKRGSADA